MKNTSVVFALVTILMMTTDVAQQVPKGQSSQDDEDEAADIRRCGSTLSRVCETEDQVIESRAPRQVPMQREVKILCW